MACTITKGQTFASTEQVTSTKLHTLVDSATIAGITTSEIASDAAIAFSQLAALTSAKILVGNGSNVAAAVAVSGDVALTNAGATTVTDLTIASEADGDMLIRNTNWVRLAKGTEGQALTMGASLPAWATLPSRTVYITGSGNWTCPAGITLAYITMVGGGGGGASGTAGGNEGGGGGAGAYITKAVYLTTPTSTYAYAVGALGAKGAYGANGSAGGDTTFGTGIVLTCKGGSGGVWAENGAGGAGGIASNTPPSGMTAGGIYSTVGVAGAAASTPDGGGGAGSPFGWGGTGGDNGGAAATSASGYGAGGGGGDHEGNHYGGNGASGIIIIEY